MALTVGDNRLGDNRYSDSLIALDADTGTLRWHFQFTPHDVLDMDPHQVPVLVDAEFQGRQRKLVLFANRKGFYYVLDRLNGEFLLGKQFAKQTWAFGLDPRGRPIVNPAAVPTVEGTRVYPAYVAGRLFMGGSRRPVPGEEPWGALRALDWRTGEMAWEFRVHTPPWAGSSRPQVALSFPGRWKGDFFALDAVSGKLLWRLQTGGAFWSNPMSYRYEGKRYVAVAAGNSLIAFGVDR